MKFALVSSAVAAALIAATPAPASAEALSAGISVNDGRVSGHLALVDHDRGYRDHRRAPRRHGRHGRRGHRRFGRCETWRYAHRKLHRRFGHVRLLRRTHNRRGDRIFIARAGNHRGRIVRVRYNACLGRVMAVKRIRGHHRGHHPRQHPRRHLRRRLR